MNGRGVIFVIEIAESEPAENQFDDEQKQDLIGFDPAKDKLFAYSETEVIAYPSEDRGQFFAMLLEDPGFCKDTPELRLGFARASGDPALIDEAEQACEKYTKTKPNKYLLVDDMMFRA